MTDSENADFAATPSTRPMKAWAAGLILALIGFNLWLYLPLFGAHQTAVPGPPPPPTPGAEASAVAFRPSPASKRPGTPPPPPPPGKEGKAVASAERDHPPPPPPGPGRGEPPPPRPAVPGKPPPPGAAGKPPAGGDDRKPGGIPNPPSPPRPRLGATELQLGLLLLEASSDPGLRLKPAQKARLLPLVQRLLEPLRTAYAEASLLQGRLTAAQLAYLERNRGPLDLKNAGVQRPGQDPVLARALEIVRQRAKDGASEAASSPATAAENVHPMSVDDLVAAPIRLESDSALRLDASQATAFEKALAGLERVSVEQEALRREVELAISPEQWAVIENGTNDIEAERRVVALRLLIVRLSAQTSR